MAAQRFGGPRLYESHPEARYLRAQIALDDGSELWFTDARRFGHAVVLDGEELDAYLDARLGLEPLSDALTPRGAGRAGGRATAPLKSFLLDQTRVAGIGNIYADEALWRARAPSAVAGGLAPARALRGAGRRHRRRARDGSRAGGASIDDYRDARGERGSAQDEFLVHTREGEECLRCGETIRRIVVGGRSTYSAPGARCGCGAPRRRRRPAATRVSAGPVRRPTGSRSATGRTRRAHRVHRRSSPRRGSGGGLMSAAAAPGPARPT